MPFASFFRRAAWLPLSLALACLVAPIGAALAITASNVMAAGAASVEPVKTEMAATIPTTAASQSGAAELFSQKPFPFFYEEAALFQRAMEGAAHVAPLSVRVSGLTLPHHLLAAPLIAEGFALVRGQRYERIVILSPNHFSRGERPFAVPVRDFSTPLGPVPVDKAAVTALLRNPLVMPSNLFSHEHGVQALLPFVAAQFPGVPVIPVTLRIRASSEEWDSLAQTLAPLLTPRTLVIQSTDFSHYFTWAEAVQKDKETLLAIASGDPERIKPLSQPGHMDSKAAQYLQMKLQKEVYAAAPVVVANTNACAFAPPGMAEPARTTSYIVQVYAHEPFAMPDLPLTQAARYVAGGDFFTGRYAAPIMADRDRRARLVRHVRGLTGGAPLLVNFEGVLQELCPQPATQAQGFPRLCMETKPTLALMHDLHIMAVGLANNHIRDFGPEAAAHTRETLEAAGIATVRAGGMRPVGAPSTKESSRELPAASPPSASSPPGLLLAAFSDVAQTGETAEQLLREADFDILRQRPAGPPLAVMVHYGTEFRADPGERGRNIALALKRAGANIILGGHSHVRGNAITDDSAVWAQSLGNFLFDQTRRNTGGAVVDIVLFKQGTWTARQRDVGNIFRDMGK